MHRRLLRSFAEGVLCALLVTACHGGPISARSPGAMRSKTGGPCPEADGCESGPICGTACEDETEKALDEMQRYGK